jgi:hypothetical protein
VPGTFGKSHTCLRIMWTRPPLMLRLVSSISVKNAKMKGAYGTNKATRRQTYHITPQRAVKPASATSGPNIRPFVQSFVQPMARLSVRSGSGHSPAIIRDASLGRKREQFLRERLQRYTTNWIRHGSRSGPVGLRVVVSAPAAPQRHTGHYKGADD